MTDPFDALREPIRPVAPDPGFANQLRARLLIALGLPASSSRGAPMTTAAAAAPLTDLPAGAAIPYLAVTDARRAIDWYVEVFSARVVHEPIVMPDDRIGHVELELGTGLLYMADEHPEIGHVAPVSGAAAVGLVLRVPDVDATVAAAVAAGAELTRDVYEDHGHRGATLVDPFGHRWMVQTPLPEPATAPPGDPAVAARQGDIVYASLSVLDVARATAFFGSVLGWRTDPAEPGHARHVDGALPHLGVMGGHERPSMFLCFGVDDLDAAAERVQASGGQAGEPTDEPWGRIAECRDPDDTPFALYQLTARDLAEAVSPSGGERPINGGGHGDLCYITVEAVDSTRSRAFYGAVLGWEFAPGRVEDGWGVRDSAPMVGLHGGNPEVTVVPMYRVDDIPAAVDRVRAAGGTSTDPAVQPYGISAECVDDQGTRFYLGQLS